MAVTSAVIAVGSAFATHKGVQAQRKAQKREANVQRRMAEIENVKRARRAIAQRRIQEAELIQAGVSEGIRNSSGISGAVGSLRTQTASNIGAANTQLAGSIAANRALLRGARQAGNWGTVASAFNAAGGVVSTGINAGWWGNRDKGTT